MEYQPVPRYIVPASTEDTAEPPFVLNPLRTETAVEFILGSYEEVTLNAWLNPGLYVGQLLTVRQVLRPLTDVNSLHPNNQATLNLHALVPSTLNPDYAYMGFNNASYPAEIYTFREQESTPYWWNQSINTTFFWTGTQWYVTVQSGQ